MTTAMRLSMAITADASGVAPATAEARREIDALGSDARDAAAGLSAHAAANDQAAAASRRATEAVRGQSAAERDLRAAVVRFSGERGPLNDNAFKARAADIAAYGDGLDRLRAKYNPLFATIQSYKAAQSEIRRAHTVGAIGVDEMAAALGRERQAALASIAAIKGRGSALASTRGGGAGSFHTANIAAQFQYIGVTSAMGMSPLQIALQQGTQLSMVFEQMKASGQSAGAGIAAAFRSVLSPMSLVTIGVIGVGAALIQYVGGLKADIPSVDDILSRHEDHISRLGPAYDAAAKARRDYATQSAAAMDAVLTGDLEKANEKIQALAAAALGEIQKAISSEAFQMGPAAGLVPSRFEPFREVIDLFKEGRIDAIGFAEGVRQIELANPQFGAVAAELRSFTDGAVDATLKLSGVTGEVDRVALAVGQMQAEIDRINPFAASGRLADIEKQVGSLVKQTAAGEIGIGTFSQSIEDIADANPDISAIISKIGQIGMAAFLAQQQVEKLAGGAAAKGNRVRPQGMDDAQSEFDFLIEFERRIGDTFDKIDPAKLEKPKADRAANAYRDLIKAADDRIAQLKIEIDMVGRAGSEVEALRYEQELLAQATDKGRSIDEKQTAEIKAKAAEYGRLRAELAATKLEQDLLFEREQLFRSPTEQRVHSTLRGAGIDPESEQGQLLAGQIRYNEQLELGRDLAMDFGASLVEAFSDGKITGEEFLGILFDIVQQLISMPGSLSALGSFLGSLFGGGVSGNDAFSLAMDPFAKGGAFASGKIVPFSRGGAFTNSIVDRPTLFSFAKGSKFGEMGEAGAEAIMPLKRNAAGQLGVVAAANQNGGGQLQVSIGVSVDNDGNLQAYVKDVAQREGTQAAVSIVRDNNEAMENRFQNGAAR